MPIEAVHLAQPANRTDSPPSHASRNAVSQKQHQLLKTSCDVTCGLLQGLARQDLVLPPERKLRQPCLYGPHYLQWARKEEAEICSQHFKSPSTQKSRRLRRTDLHCIVIELTLVHHILRPRIPRVVFPQPKDPTGPQASRDISHGIVTLSNRDMVEDPVAVNHVRQAIRRVICKRQKPSIHPVPRARLFQRKGRDIESQHRLASHDLAQ